MGAPDGLIVGVTRRHLPKAHGVEIARSSPVIDYHDMAQTGTGKTAEYGLPVLQKTEAGLRRPQTLILCPTREL